MLIHEELSLFEIHSLKTHRCFTEKGLYTLPGTNIRGLFGPSTSDKFKSFIRLLHFGRLQVFLLNNGLGWKALPGTNISGLFGPSISVEFKMFIRLL
jgi:hypothetical protein